jgi:hypothetical protein
MTKYEKPKIVDYGSLLELTAQGTAPNADVPHGGAVSAYWPS